MPKLTDKDRELLQKMADDPPETLRSFDERIAFEHWWDDEYEKGQHDQ